jgi:hypothetical protein
MLSYNVPIEAADRPADCARADRDPARSAHVAHAMVLGFHSLCCGVPLALALMTSGAIGLLGLTALQHTALEVHAVLHAYEGVILAVSAFLVVLGGGLELVSRQKRGARGLPILFAASVVCLAANAALVMSHRHDGGVVSAQAIVHRVQAERTLSATPVAMVDVHGHEHAH